MRQEKRAFYHYARSVFKPRSTDIVKTGKNKKSFFKYFFARQINCSPLEPQRYVISLKKTTYRSKIHKLPKNVKWLHQLKYIKLTFHKDILIFCVWMIYFSLQSLSILVERHKRYIIPATTFQFTTCISASVFLLIRTSLFWCTHTAQHRKQFGILEHSCTRNDKILICCAPFYWTFPILFFHVA